MRKLLLCLVLLPLSGCMSEILECLMNVRKPEGPGNPGNPPNPPPVLGEPFGKDSCTVLLADFEGDMLNRATGTSGSLQGGRYAGSLYGSGIRSDGSGKFLAAFPNSRALSLRSGSLEALVRYDGRAPGFSHIIDKSWQYAVSAHDGRLAAWFGSNWWYTDVALPEGEWAYVAVVFDGDTLRLYLNGKPAAATPYTGAGNPESSSGYDVGIGNASDPGFNIPFQGLVDAVRISGCAVPAEEIAATGTRIARKVE